MGEIQDLLLPGSEKIIRAVNLVSSRENISGNRFGFSENRKMNYKGEGLRILQTFAKIEDLLIVNILKKMHIFLKILKN